MNETDYQALLVLLHGTVSGMVMNGH